MSAVRIGRALAACVAAALAGCGQEAQRPDGGSSPAAPAVATSGAVAGPVDLRRDPRVAEVPADCARSGPYLRDTADPVPILLEKLERGDAEVLARACEELGAMGAASVPALRRLLAEQVADPTRTLVLQNTVRALALNPDPAATDLLLGTLTHPVAEIRAQALGVLAQRDLAPEDFDVLRDAATWESGRGQADAIAAMWSADPVRAADQILDWLEAGKAPTEPGNTGRLVARATDPDTLARLARIAPSVPLAYAPYVDMPLHLAGEADAVERTTRRLTDPDPWIRAATLAAAHAAGSVDLVAWFARDDPSEELRTLAVQHLVGLLEGEAGDAAADALVAALDDPAPAVGRAALDALVRRSHPTATDRALALLDGGRRELEAVLPALHVAMTDDRALTERVRGTIERRLEQAEGPDAQRDLMLVQALALCPGAESARAVLEVADTTPPGTELEGIRAFRFLAIQLANTGAEGRAVVAERLERETDPLRRIDLLWTIGAVRDDLARRTLAAHVDREELDPWERVYAAHLLAKVGPTAEVAPVLEAAARRFEGPARRALDCLLWRWY